MAHAFAHTHTHTRIHAHTLKRINVVLKTSQYGRFQGGIGVELELRYSHQYNEEEEE